MKRQLFGFLFYPVLLGSAVFLVASMSSMYSDLSKEMVYERLEGNAEYTILVSMVVCLSPGVKHLSCSVHS